MGLERDFSGAIKRAGGPAELIRGDESYAITASIQPVISGTGRAASPAGFGDNTGFKFYAAYDEAACLILRGDEITSGGERYHVEKAEIIYLGEKPVYIQGLLRRCEGNE